LLEPSRGGLPGDTAVFHTVIATETNQSEHAEIANVDGENNFIG
jgi:hypothetical protein